MFSLREWDRLRGHEGLWPNGLDGDSEMPWWQNQHYPWRRQGVGKEEGSGLGTLAVETRLNSELGQTPPSGTFTSHL